MSTFIKKLFENDEPFSISKIILALFAITTIRAFLDLFASPDTTNYFFIPKDTFVQFPLYYFWVFLIFGLVLYYFSKKSLNQIVNFEIKLFLFVLIKPIVDLLATSGQGAFTICLSIAPEDIFSTFFKTMNPFQFYGITLGIHVAAYSIFLLMAIFVYRATKSILKSCLTVLISYSILFVFAILPSLLALPRFFQEKTTSISDAYDYTIRNSWMITTLEHTFDRFTLFQPSVLTLPQYSEPATQISFLLVFILLVVYLTIFKPTLSNVLKKNLRLERVFYWVIIATIGIVINQKIFGTINLFNIANMITLAVFFLLIALNAWLAVCINDTEDVAIDEISNPDRPLVKKNISSSEWNNLQLILLILVISGDAIMNHNVTFLLVLAQMSYYMYSAKPFRLKNNFLTSSLLIGLASVAIAMAGFYLVSPDQHIAAFPIKAIFLIGISYALLSNLKDIKDFKGDFHEGMQTIPVVFGLENSKHIIAILFGAVIVVVPLSLKIYLLFFPSILIAIFTYYLFTKKEYQEKYIFLVFFLYMLMLFIATK